MRCVTSVAVVAALALMGGATESVSDLSYDQLVSFVMFENEEAYRDPTGYFCKFIALSDNDDYCKAGMTSLDPKLCKIEVTRELRATYEASGRKGREFMKTRDVFVLSSLNLNQLEAPEVDAERKTSRANFEAAIAVHHKEAVQYSVLLDERGEYRACRVGGEEKAITLAECESQGIQPTQSSKKMSLLFNSSNYRRAIAALQSLQKQYCSSAGEPL